MRIKIGEVEALYRYPVKSMKGERVESADVGWHGLVGDRRLALRRLEDRNGFPWLTASKLPDLIRFAPQWRGSLGIADLPSHVRAPDGQEHGIFSRELAAEIGRRHGSPVEMVHLNRGIFDEASLSLITAATVNEIGALAGHLPDVRRFRPNVLIASSVSRPFEEDEWVGGELVFGEADDAVAVCVTNWDERCSMVNFDPDTACPDVNVMKTIARVRNNQAGVYGAVKRRGRIHVGQSVFFAAAATAPRPV